MSSFVLIYVNRYFFMSGSACNQLSDLLLTQKSHQHIIFRDVRDMDPSRPHPAFPGQPLRWCGYDDDGSQVSDTVKYVKRTPHHRW